MTTIVCKCLVCSLEFTAITHSSSGQKDGDDQFGQVVQDMWTMFCKLFNVDNSQWADILHYFVEVRDLPFCEKCRNPLAQLLLFDRQLQSIEKKCRKIRLSVTQTILETSSPSSSWNADRSQHENGMLFNRIEDLRRNIFKSFNPQVILMDCCPGVNLNYNILEPLASQQQQQQFNPVNVGTRIKKENYAADQNDDDEYLIPDLIQSAFDDSYRFEKIKIEPDHLDPDYVHEEQEEEEQEEVPISVNNYFDIKVENDDNEDDGVQPKVKKPSIVSVMASKYTERSEDYIKCGLCDRLFRNNFCLMKHMNSSIHKKPFLTKRKKKKILEKDKTWTESNMPGILRMKNDENVFEYGGWRFEKIANNVFRCMCGQQVNSISSIRCHIIIRHLASRPPSQFPKQGGGEISKHLGNGKYVYRNTHFEKIPSGLFQCELCSRTTPGRDSMVSHIKTKHFPECCRFYCRPCNRGFEARTTFMRHEKTHTRQRWWRVGVGSYIYDQKFEFDAVDNGYVCGTCGFIGREFRLITQHIRDSHSAPENCVCSHCGRQFLHRASLLKHTKMKFCHGKDFRMLGDQILYKEKWLVDKLDLVVDPIDEKNSKCRFRCVACGQERSSRAPIFRHIREKHIEGPREEFYCASCQKYYQCQYQLNIHNRTVHSNLRPFECDVEGCDKTFKTKKYLQNHHNAVHLKLKRPSYPRTTDGQAQPILVVELDP